MIELKLRDVAAAARARYEAGTLSAQAPLPVCEYRTVQYVEEGHGYVSFACAIGAGMTDEEVAELESGYGDDFQIVGIDALKEAGLIDGDDFPALLELQQEHDTWGSLKASPFALDAKRRFLQKLNVLAPVAPRPSDPDAQVRETEETEREAGDDSAND